MDLNTLAITTTRGAGSLADVVASLQLGDYVPKVINAVVILLVGYLFSRFVLGRLKEWLKKTNINPTFHGILLQMLKFLLMLTIVLMIIGVFGIGGALGSVLTPLLGTIGLALSLAMKDDLSNYISGLLILGNKQFVLDDYIKVGEHEGTVAEISLSHTLLRTKDNKQVYIPNAIIAKSCIINSTGESTRRLIVKFTINRLEDIGKAKEAIGQVLEASGQVLSDPPSFVGVADVEGKVQIEVRATTKTEDVASLRYKLNEEVPRALALVGVAMR